MGRDMERRDMVKRHAAPPFTLQLDSTAKPYLAPQYRVSRQHVSQYHVPQYHLAPYPATA
jgi:hypothetical protein